ncbi:MAG TPA: hypothetical protein VGL38_14600 [bacterium]|jgi:hypothetical protein
MLIEQPWLPGILFDLCEEDMSKGEVIIATTQMSRHGFCITRDYLERASQDIRLKGCMPIDVEHIHTVPPIGRIAETRVVALDDNVYALVAKLEYFELERPYVLPSGDPVVWRRVNGPSHPFASDASPPAILGIQYDPVNIDSEDDLQFIKAALPMDGAAVFSPFSRNARIPDPELIIAVGEALVKLFLVKYVLKPIAEEIGRQISAEFGVFMRSTKSVCARWAQRAIPLGKCRTYIVHIAGTPEIDLAAETADVDLFLGALTEEKTGEAIRHAHDLHQHIAATKIQYLLDGDGHWKFNYLLTSEGDVIGTPLSFDRQKRRYELSFSQVSDDPDATGSE